MELRGNNYAELLSQVLPTVIETEEENERVLKIIEELMSKDLSPDESKLFKLLVKLVEDFEDKAYPMGETSTPLSMLLFLMEQHDLRQIDLVDVFGSRGRVSDIVNSKRISGSILDIWAETRPLGSVSAQTLRHAS